LAPALDVLVNGVKALRPFLPAKDFAKSRAFYETLGFRAEPLGDKLVALHLGPHSFLLQDYYVEQWAANCMMHVFVADLGAWWQHIASLDLPARYGVEPPRPPKPESWGLTVAYVFDPSGVLWHFAEQPHG
jgi:catechol 2,3-dioxygenase-like lactoylglutathione lyase family enzyme